MTFFIIIYKYCMIQFTTSNGKSLISDLLTDWRAHTRIGEDLDNHETTVNSSDLTTNLLVDVIIYYIAEVLDWRISRVNNPIHINYGDKRFEVHWPELIRSIYFYLLRSRKIRIPRWPPPTKVLLEKQLCPIGKDWAKLPKVNSRLLHSRDESLKCSCSETRSPDRWKIESCGLLSDDRLSESWSEAILIVSTRSSCLLGRGGTCDDSILDCDGKSDWYHTLRGIIRNGWVLWTTWGLSSPSRWFWLRGRFWNWNFHRF